MSLAYYLNKIHLFKNKQTRNYLPIPKYGTIFFYALKILQFEFVYIRVLKKLLRRKYFKAPLRFFRPKFWFLLKANSVISQKSKNARMGAGVGLKLRIVRLIWANSLVCEFWGFHYLTLLKIQHYLFLKCRLSFFCLNKFLH